MSGPVKPKIVLEQDKPFKDSMLWELQRDFYKQEGIDAWSRQVPFYITSNPSIANSYAHIIIRYMQDAILAGEATASEPFYIIELGAGTGTFSFYLFKRLRELRSALELAHLRFVYVMTDMVDGNVWFWRQHPQLTPYIESGELDFAIYDADHDQEIHLLNSDAILKAGSPFINNPMLLVANYVFDSMHQDLFLVEKDKISEALVTLSTPAGCEQEPSLQHIKLDLSYCECSWSYYDDPDLDALLESYRGAERAYLLLPSGALRCIRKIANMAGQKLCLLVSDKGYAHTHEDYLLQEPMFALHGGCFSLPLNLDVIARFFNHRNGSAYHQHQQYSLITSLFTMGIDRRVLPEMQVAASQYINGAGHSFIFQAYDRLLHDKSQASLDTLLMLMPAALWDPYLFDNHFDELLGWVKACGSADPGVKELTNALDGIAGNYFYTPAAPNTLLNIGILLYETGSYKQALYWLERSLNYETPMAEKQYYLGLCHYRLKSKDLALHHFEQALGSNPKHILSRGWISQLQSELSKA